MNDFLDMDNNEILKENNNKKFDILISNPPYDNRLHEHFLAKYVDLADKIISIQPLSWLLKKKQNINITKYVDDSYTDIEIIEKNKYFKDAHIPGTLSINLIDLKNTNKEIKYNGKKYKKCEEIKLFSDDKYLVEFNSLTQPPKDNLNLHVKSTKYEYYEPNPNEEWWCIKVSKIQSNTGDSFYSIISSNNSFIHNKANYGQYKDIKKIPNQKGNYEFMYFAFNTKNELDNFINYIKTDFVRTCLMLTKHNGNMHRGCMKSIPWFDFSDEHFNKSPREIDDWLFDKYKISDEIRKHIEEILPDYYGIRK